MKTLIAWLAVLLLAGHLFGQDQELVPWKVETKLNLGQAIAQGAAKSVSDLESRIAVLEQLTTEYSPTYTWPGSTGPQPFEALRKHLNGEVIHKARNLANWTNRELAFVHDCEHVQEALDAGKGLPVLKDQRLRDWVRAKNPAKALPKKLGWSVKRIVMHTMNGCSRCDDWKRDDKPQAEADGVTIEVQHEGNGVSGRSYPYFEVQYCSDEQCRNFHYGYVRYQTMKQAAGSL